MTMTEPAAKPSRAHTRAERRTRNMVIRRSRTKTPYERLSVAFDYFRGTVADHAMRGVGGDEAAIEVVEYLTRRADELNNIGRQP